MNKFLYVLLPILLIPTGLLSNQSEIDTNLLRANKEYKAKNYAGAIESYAALVDSGFHSSGLYYNMGNACFKQGDFPRAILYYERALLLDPTDEDIQFNLSKSKTFMVDKIEIIPEFFVKRWINKSVLILKSDSWAWISLLAFTLAISGAIIFLFSRKISIKKFILPLVVILVLASAFSGFCAVKSKKYIESSTSAIIMAPTVTVKSSPDLEGVDVFIIHEGTKVDILRSLSGWHEIRIADGKQGWLRNDEIERI